MRGNLHRLSPQPATARSVSNPPERSEAERWESLAETFADTLATSEEVTRRIRALYAPGRGGKRLCHARCSAGKGARAG